MLAPAATAWRMAMEPEWYQVPSPRFWKTWPRPVKREVAAQFTPSPPIWIKRGGLAVHPARHEVAADAGHGLAALGDLGRGVVRAAGAEIGGAGGAGDGEEDGRLGQRRGAAGEAFVREEAVEAAGDDGHEEAGGELAGPGDEAVVVLVALADHALGLVAGVVVEILLELALDDAALLLDDEDLLLVADEGERAGRQASGQTMPTL